MHQPRRDALHIQAGGTVGVPGQQRDLPADRVLDVRVAPDIAGHRRGAAEKGHAGAGQGRCGPLAGGRVLDWLTIRRASPPGWSAAYSFNVA